jgi:large subunit ribosomal protein L13
MTSMARTTFATKQDHEQAMGTWYVVDASKHVLGRMATTIATVLMGKHRPNYTPHVLVGDGVVVLNARQLVVTSNKLEREIHTRWSGYPGGLKEESMGRLLDRNPELLIKNAVRRMLPKNRIGRQMLARLKVYAGADHPHSAQQPKPLEELMRRGRS